ncbi:alpha/beta hydrolase [Leptolyngbya sp. AN02str]|uniref:alpha/beta fold hydrolase n=1 Tax=Leptolyngbya sp. AN02str TaxID=3423363 RepID=UPI003D318E3E
MVDTVDVLGTPHAYELTETTNTAPVLVFVHGWLLSRAYWQPIIQQLAPHYSCLTYDLRGFGGSQPCYRPTAKEFAKPAISASAVALTRSNLAIAPGQSTSQAIATSTSVEPPTGSGYTPADYAQDLGILLQQLNLSNVWLVGHSLGGSIALWAADLWPDQVKGVICLNSGGGIYLKEEFERFRAAGQQLVRLRPRWLCYVPMLDIMMTYMNVARPISRTWGRQRMQDWVVADPQAALGTLLDSTTAEEVHRLPQVVSRLQQPVYFIAGQSDTVMEPQYVRHLASYHHLFDCSGENVIEIADCGHLAMLEQPDAVSQAILNVLQTHTT